jgi:4-carboxymuconolactone decarboxylase
MSRSAAATRVPPIEAPYPPEVARSLTKMMGNRSDIEPLRLFRTLARHFALADRIRPFGSGLLVHGTLDPAEREVVILRTCARCACEYEWGVHVRLFARPLGLSEAIIRATVTGDADDPAFTARQTLLIRLADELHETATVSDPLWQRLTEWWNPQQLIELLLLAGWYHLIAFAANGLQVAPEDWAERFPQTPASPRGRRPRR